MFGGRGGRVPWYERGRRFLGQGDGRWTPTPLEEVYYMQDSTFSSHFTLQHLWQLCPWLWSSLRMQPSRRLERAQMIMQLLLVVLCVGWVVLAMVFGILPSAPLIVGAMEALPGLALTPMLTEQLRNLGEGLNVKQSAVQSSTAKFDHTFSLQTLVEWFNRKIPDSMACLDADVEEDVLERGMAHAPPEPWHRVDEGLCADLGLPGMNFFSFTYERMSHSSEKCSSPSCQQEDVRSTATASFLSSDGAAAVWVKKRMK